MYKNSDIHCERCLRLENEVINLISSSDNYKRSLAVSNAFKFLLDKLRKNENDFLQFKSELEDIIYDLKMENNNLISNKNNLQNELFEMSKFFTKVKNLEDELIKLRSDYNMKINNEIENLNTINQLDNENENLLKQIHESSDTIRKFQELECLNRKEISVIKNNETRLNKKLKSFEIIMHKLDLENQNYRECIKSISISKMGNSESVIVPSCENKLNLVEEIKAAEEILTTDISISIDKEDHRAPRTRDTDTPLANQVHKATSTSNLTEINKDSINFDDSIAEKINIEEVVNQIKLTENILRIYSAKLQNSESESTGNKNSDIKEYLRILEEKANYLLLLKKQYNYIYNKLNNY